MKTVSKKLLSLLLVAILLVSALPFQAFADAHTGVNETYGPLDDTQHCVYCAQEGCSDHSAGGWVRNENHTFGTDGVCTKCGATQSTTVAHVGEHLAEVWDYNSTTHWQVCHYAGCELEGQKVAENAHTFDANGVCTVCKYGCPHPYGSQILDASTAVAADCIHPGKEADLICNDCKARLKEGAPTPATGVHNFVNGICTVEGCGATQEGTPCVLTLDADGGTINGVATATVNVKKGSPIGTLPIPTRQGYTFAGWYVGDTLVNYGQVYTFDGNVTAKAKWTEITYQLTVRRVLNGNNATAKTIKTVNVPAGTPLLGYLNENIASIVRSELALNPGYTWEYSYWRDYSGTQPLTDQTACMNQAQTVFVNFVSKSYTLYFNANGGAVTPLSKPVYFGSPVGTLPTASLNGKVFQGWQDVNGNLYNANTIYQVADDTSLTAVWKDEALVILYIYVNGDFSSCNRMILMDKYVKNDNISRADVYGEIVKYYTPASGTLSIAGLFDEYTWSSYRANTSKAGTENIEIDASHPNKIYVMVNNANTGSTIITGGTGSTIIPTIPANGATTPAGAYWINLGNGNGYWVYPAPSTPNATYPTYIIIGSNPKTGDTAKIEIAAAVMVLAAAALITVMALRKKKSV